MGKCCDSHSILLAKTINLVIPDLASIDPSVQEGLSVTEHVTEHVIEQVSKASDSGSESRPFKLMRFTPNFISKNHQSNHS